MYQRYLFTILISFTFLDLVPLFLGLAFIAEASKAL
jgi:hypothetical protein